jgi:hypothetical protein
VTRFWYTLKKIHPFDFLFDILQLFWKWWGQTYFEKRWRTLGFKNKGIPKTKYFSFGVFDDCVW